MRSYVGVSIEELESELAAARQQYKKLGVVVRGDGHAQAGAGGDLPEHERAREAGPQLLGDQSVNVGVVPSERAALQAPQIELVGPALTGLDATRAVVHRANLLFLTVRSRGLRSVRERTRYLYLR